MPSMHQRPAMPLGEVGSYLLVELIIVEQPVQFFEHRVEPRRRLRHTNGDTFRFIAIDQHS